MSNVLIGIIGVILFIGLALAGALILGDDFRSSQAETRAARYASTLAQIEQATAMFRLKRGIEPRQGDFEIQLVPRFIRHRPNLGAGVGVGWRNPSNDGNPAEPVILAAITVPNSESNRLTCQLFNEQIGAGSTIPSAPVAPPAHMGCFRVSETWGVDAMGTYYFYRRL